jgi:hypothetical protein
MSWQSGIGSGSTIDDLLNTILRRLDSMEEKLQPLGHHLAGVGGDGAGVLHADGDSDVPNSGGGDGTTMVIEAGMVLATIGDGGSALDEGNPEWRQ